MSTSRQTMKTRLLTLIATAAIGGTALADFVYVTSTPSNCVDTATCGDVNGDYNVNFSPVYNENGMGNFTSAVSLAPGKPATAGARYFSISFTNSNPDLGVTINPTLGVTGGVYRVYHVFSSAAGNVSTNVLLAVTNVEGCTLSFTNGIDKFQSQYGVASGGMNVWQLLGFLTNAPDTSTPKITFYYQSGDVDAGAEKRLLIDTFLFASDSCAAIAQVAISGSYIVTSTNVTVTGVDGSATAVKVYQYANDIWTQVGQKTAGIVAGTNSVLVTGLNKGAQLAATQTIGGQEGCLWGVPTGVAVGVPNPRVRLALSLRETTNTGPAGVSGATSGFTASGNIYFLGVTNRLGSAPGYPGRVLYPSNSVWQTVTFQRGPDYANPMDPSVKWNAATGYNPAGTINDLTSNWYTLESLNFAIDDLTSTGPYDIYIDTIQNGTNVFYTFENSPAGTTDTGFRAPGFSGTTSGNLAGSPNSAVVANNAAYEGTKSMRLQWAWNGTVNTKWLRLTTSGVGNPLMNVEDPITIRFLFVPDGGTMPPPPPRPTLSANLLSGQTLLNWVGGHRLQTSVEVTGTYTNVPGATLAPYTNNFADPQRFFRLVD